MRIKNLKIKNFKGIKDLEIGFDTESVTNIYGANGTGKTTIFDAFTWLLTEKDSFGRKQFEIKTLTPENKYLHRLTHSVEGTFLQPEGVTITLKREYVEKWTKKRGEEENSFTGHETNHFVHGIPITKKEYQDVIEKIIPESIISLITNPFWFPSLKWEEKRKLVLQMTGEPTPEQVAGNDQTLNELVQAIGNTDMEMWKKKIRADKKAVKEKMDQIPPVITELSNKQFSSLSRQKLQEDATNISEDIKILQQRITDRKAVNDEKNKEYEALISESIILKQRIFNEKTKLADEVFSKKNKEKQKAHIEYGILHTKLTSIRELENDLSQSITKRNGLLAEREELLRQYSEWNDKSFQIKESDTTCYACGQALPDAAETIETNKKAFLQKQRENLDGIMAKGLKIKPEIENLELRISITESSLKKDEKEKILAQIEELNKSLNINTSEPTAICDSLNLIDLEERLKKKNEQIKDFAQILNEEVDISDLEEQQEKLQEEQKEIFKQLWLCDEQDKNKKRISELIEEEKSYGVELARIEKLEFQTDLFVKKKLNLMEALIKEKFNGVEFKMNNELINGGEEPTCEILINGVPFDNANHSAKINTGIKIINAFSKHYNVSAPIFVDNAEAVNTLEPSENQCIRLVVVDNAFEVRNKQDILL